MKQRIRASGFCGYMHLFFKSTRLYACEAFTIRENDGLVAVNLRRSRGILLPQPASLTNL